MRIGIDARLINETGVGRYIRNLLYWLGTIDDQNEYIIYLNSQAFTTFSVPNSRWHKKLVDIGWHTISEQLFLPFVYVRDRIDVLHVPYFTIPIFFPGKIICTFHDLTILHEKTGKATTLPRPFYAAKHLGYRCIVALGMKRASHIITVSHTVEQEIRATYHLPAHAVSVIYEGIDANLLKKKVTSLLIK